MTDLDAIAKARTLLLAAGCAPERLLCPRVEELGWTFGIVRFRNARDERPREAAVHVHSRLMPFRSWILWREPEDLQYDPQEEDPRFAFAFIEVDAIVRQNPPWGRPLAHRSWALKKQLLMQQHGIDWKTPAELNAIVFD